MNLYDWLLFLHITAAAVLIGGSLVAAPLARAALQRAHTMSELRTWVSFYRTVTVSDPLSAVALLGTGIYLASAGSWWSAPWVVVAVVLWVVDGTMAGAVVKPVLDRLQAATDGAGTEPVSVDADRLRWSRRWTVGSDIVLANDVAVLFLMVVKPGYVRSVSVILGAHAILHGARAAGRLVRGRTSGRVGTPAGTAA